MHDTTHDRMQSLNILSVCLFISRRLPYLDRSAFGATVTKLVHPREGASRREELNNMLKVYRLYYEALLAASTGRGGLPDNKALLNSLSMVRIPARSLWMGWAYSLFKLG
jgi:hypothetical protein